MSETNFFTTPFTHLLQYIRPGSSLNCPGESRVGQAKCLAAPTRSRQGYRLGRARLVPPYCRRRANLAPTACNFGGSATVNGREGGGAITSVRRTSAELARTGRGNAGDGVVAVALAQPAEPQGETRSRRTSRPASSPRPGPALQTAIPRQRDQRLAQIVQAQAQAGAEEPLPCSRPPRSATTASGPAPQARRLRPPAARGRPGGAVQPDFDSLIDLIKSTVKPTTWDDVGGPGSISPFPTGVWVDRRGRLRPLAEPATADLAVLRGQRAAVAVRKTSAAARRCEWSRCRGWRSASSCAWPPGSRRPKRCTCSPAFIGSAVCSSIPTRATWCWPAPPATGRRARRGHPQRRDRQPVAAVGRPGGRLPHDVQRPGRPLRLPDHAAGRMPGPPARVPEHSQQAPIHAEFRGPGWSSCARRSASRTSRSMGWTLARGRHGSSSRPTIA